MPDKKLGFGLMRLPLKDENNQKSINQEEVNKMIDYCMSKGFNHFDTGYPYHEGLSEVAFKKGVVERYPREDYIICDKMPIWDVESYDDFQKFFSEQLQRCGVDYFDYYLLHNIGETFYNNTIKHNGFDFMKKIKKEGKAKKIGLSIHDDAEMLDKILSKHPEIEFVLLQINYIDWENESIESRKSYEVARKHNQEILVMEPVKGGALAKVPEEVEKLYKEYNPDLSIASWAIRYAASLEGVTTVYSGMSNFDQMKDNISFMEDFKPINNEEMELITKSVDIINESIAIPCTQCNYCLENCDENINISKYFTLFNDQKQFGFQVNLANYYMNLCLTFGKASDCTYCGECLDHCPQHIDIPDKLEEVAEVFEIEF